MQFIRNSYTNIINIISSQNDAHTTMVIVYCVHFAGLSSARQVKLPESTRKEVHQFPPAVITTVDSCLLTAIVPKKQNDQFGSRNQWRNSRKTSQTARSRHIHGMPTIQPVFFNPWKPEILLLTTMGPNSSGCVNSQLSFRQRFKMLVLAHGFQHRFNPSRPKHQAAGKGRKVHRVLPAGYWGNCNPFSEFFISIDFIITKDVSLMPSRTDSPTSSS